MSVIFVVTPILVGGWPIVAALATAAAGALGYRTVESTSVRLEGGASGLAVDEVEVSLEGDGPAVPAQAGEQVLDLVRRGVHLILRADARGACSVRVRGRGRSQGYLRHVGEEFLNEVRRQYAYRRLVTELRQRGFEIVTEEARRGGEVRLQVRRLG